MATDGVKIIDGDTAHDVYWGIMDLYDSGADFETINNRYPLVLEEYFDDFDNEVYTTACALALWEIGQMTDEKLAYVKAITEKGASVAEWTTYGAKEGKARQKVLDKFLIKISEVNTKLRARKKYRKITNLYFYADDLLAFQFDDGKYGAIICSAVEQYRGQCNYILVPTTYNANEKPTLDALKKEYILGREIGSGFDQKTTKEQQPDIEKVWEFTGKNCNFFFGVVKLAVDHKMFIHFYDKFEKVGTLKIYEGLNKTGSFGYRNSFEDIKGYFGNLENQMKIFDTKKYPISVVCAM